MQDVLPTVTQLNRELSAVRKENEFYRHELNMLQNHFDSLNRIIGHSPALLEIKQTISDYAASDLPILITGETGVGKELFAKAIHEMSPRKFHPYYKNQLCRYSYRTAGIRIIRIRTGCFFRCLQKRKAR